MCAFIAKNGRMDEMNEAVFKTTVMGGFSKNEVLEFIDKQDAQFKQREKDLTVRINTLSAGLKSETQRSEQFTQRIAELEGQLESEKKRCAEVVKKLQEVSAVAGQAQNDISGEIERRDAEISRLRNETSELARKSGEAKAAAADATARAKIFEDKLGLIDKTEDQIGRAMLLAQQTADKIVCEAKEEAEALLTKASEDAKALTTQAAERVQCVNSEAQGKITEMLRCVADYKKRVTDSRSETVEFFDTVDSVFASMQNNADDVLNNFTNAFRPEDKQYEQDESTVSNEDTAKKETAAVRFDFSAEDRTEDSNDSNDNDSNENSD
jgi:chromosome segregation ATPase